MTDKLEHKLEQGLRQEHQAYETTLAACCHYDGILSVLTQHRPYFESLPSIRRLRESMVIIPLPNVRSREVTEINGQLDTNYRIRPLPCDMAVMVCDPEWQIKTGIEIVLFIQRPGEGFSDLLQRWRQTKAELGQGVEWMMPRQHRHLLSEGTETPHPLFVVFTPGQPQPTNEAIAANQATHSPIEATPTTETQTTEVKTAEIKTAKTTETTGIHPIVTLEHRSANIIHGLTGAQLPIAIQPLTP